MSNDVAGFTPARGFVLRDTLDALISLDRREGQPEKLGEPAISAR